MTANAPLRIQSSLLGSIPGIRYGFGTIAMERSLLQDSAEYERRLKWRQVHGTRIVKVREDSAAADFGECDGFYSEGTVPVEIVTADCLPVIWSRRDGKKVGAVHAGWRGLYGGILRSFENVLREEGESPSDWVAVIGPSNRACCYEVSEDLIEQFAAQFPKVPREILTPTFRKLDLARIAERELREIGVSEVEILPYCTFCHRDANDSPTFHSYRRGNNGARLYSWIQRLPSMNGPSAG